MGSNRETVEVGDAETGAVAVWRTLIAGLTQVSQSDA